MKGLDGGSQVSSFLFQGGGVWFFFFGGLGLMLIVAPAKAKIIDTLPSSANVLSVRLEHLAGDEDGYVLPPSSEG